jgi:hypothetical protein
MQVSSQSSDRENSLNSAITPETLSTNGDHRGRSSWLAGYSNAGIAGSNSVRSMGIS